MQGRTEKLKIIFFSIMNQETREKSQRKLGIETESSSKLKWGEEDHSVQIWQWVNDWIIFFKFWLMRKWLTRGQLYDQISML